MKILRTIPLLLAFASLATGAWSEGKVTIRVVECQQRVTEANRGESGNWLNLIDAFEKENPDIKVEVVDIPYSGDGSEAFMKEDILTASGDTYDIIEHTNTIRIAKYVNAGFLMPLNDLAKAANYDPQAKFGKFLKKYDGKILWLPTDFSANIVFYNKALFDAAKVPYPKAGWTWDDYAAIAKKISDPKKGVYGSLMQQWEYYTYIGPQQKNISAYKADGTSNFDNPEYSKWLKFFADLGKSKAQPDWTEMTNKKFQWDSFLTGRFGMEMIGTWHLGPMADSKTYPRDWKFGIVAPPVATDGKGGNILTGGGGFAMNKKAAHPKEAFRFLTYIVDHYGDYNPQNYLARADQSSEALKARFTQDAAGFAADGLTADDFINAIFNPKLGTGDEKIVGPASAVINPMFVAEAERYLVGAQTLDATMKNIKKKADAAIAKEKDAQK